MIIKMRYFLILVLVLTFLSGCSTIKPSEQEPLVTIKETESFSEVISVVTNMNNRHGPENVLIVLDIDNTILTSSVDLGGDIWYQWQREKLAIKPDQSQKVFCLFEDSIGLLYELGPMILTEETVPYIISAWQASGNVVMALTSRAPKYRAATERELENKGINFELSALAEHGQKAPTYREFKNRELSYMKGIMMTSGMNKGEMLDYILKKTNRTFKAIVFVDDSQKNIDAVYKKFKEKLSANMIIFHYIKIEEDRKRQYGAILTPEQARKMDADWKTLNEVLNRLFPARNLSEGCLSNN